MSDDKPPLPRVAPLPKMAPSETLTMTLLGVRHCDIEDNWVPRKKRGDNEKR